MKTDDEVIAIRNLSFSVQTRKIIDTVSLTVQHKCIAGIIGPNGSGKTTLLKHLYRALPADKKTDDMFLIAGKCGTLIRRDKGAGSRLMINVRKS